MPSTSRLHLVIGLPLRDHAGRTNLLKQIYDPQSTNYHRYLTPEQFAARFGPTEGEYQQVVALAESNGFVVTGRHAGRELLDVSAAVADIERAFQVELRTYRHPLESREFHAPDKDPSAPTDLPILDVSGLTTTNCRVRRNSTPSLCGA